jgi:metal-sulfur cluster biosynthetic enzyme
MMSKKSRVESALEEVVDPCSAANGTDLSVVEMGLVESIEIEGRRITVNLRLTSPDCTMVGYFEEEIEREVESLNGVETVDVSPDQGFSWRPSMLSEKAKRQRERRIRERKQKYSEKRIES